MAATLPDIRTRDGRVDAVLWGATLVCGVLTFVLSLLTVPPGTDAFRHADKLEHAVAYLVTSFLLFLVAIWRPGRGDGAFARWGVGLPIAVIAAGGAIELIQSRVGREAEGLDWAVEIVAVAVAYGIVTSWRRRSAT